MIGIMSWKQLPYYATILFFKIFILALITTAKYKPWFDLCVASEKSAVVLCESRQWSKPHAVDLRANNKNVDQITILTHLKCMGTSI